MYGRTFGSTSRAIFNSEQGLDKPSHGFQEPREDDHVIPPVRSREEAYGLVVLIEVRMIGRDGLG